MHNTVEASLSLSFLSWVCCTVKHGVGEAFSGVYSAKEASERHGKALVTLCNKSTLESQAGGAL